MRDHAAALESVLRRLGLDPLEVRDLSLISRGSRSRVYRLRMGAQRSVLKWYPEGATHEPQAYALLGALRVPTLTLLAHSDDALLLEDLETSLSWRTAEEGDLRGRETGRAVAEWYQFLHLAGRDLVVRGAPDWLELPWRDLSPEAISALPDRLGLERTPVWRLAAEHIEFLKAAVEALPLTLSYHDFHWSNLALSRGAPRKAIVFDYHLLKLGLVWSDCRNVLTSLGPAAAEAFLESYGEVDPQEKLLDGPLSVLEVLQAAAQLPSVPRWALGALADARSGRLASLLEDALASL